MSNVKFKVNIGYIVNRYFKQTNKTKQTPPKQTNRKQNGITNSNCFNCRKMLIAKRNTILETHSLDM